MENLIAQAIEANERCNAAPTLENLAAYEAICMQITSQASATELLAIRKPIEG